jgi:hypothetical protein
MAHTVNLIFDGNSLFTSSFSTAPAKIQETLGKEFTVTMQNYAVSGQSTPAMASDAATQVDTAANLNKQSNILVAWELTNHMATANNATALEAYTAMRTYCLARKAAGFKVVTATCMARATAGGIIPADFEAKRLTCNALMRQNWREFADAFVDWAIDAPELEDVRNCSDLLFFNADLTHQVIFGDRLIQAAFYKAVRSLLPAKENPYSSNDANQTQIYVSDSTENKGNITNKPCKVVAMTATNINASTFYLHVYDRNRVVTASPVRADYVFPVYAYTEIDVAKQLGNRTFENGLAYYWLDKPVGTGFAAPAAGTVYTQAIYLPLPIPGSR